MQIRRASRSLVPHKVDRPHTLCGGGKKAFEEGMQHPWEREGPASGQASSTSLGDLLVVGDPEKAGELLATVRVAPFPGKV